MDNEGEDLENIFDEYENADQPAADNADDGETNETAAPKEKIAAPKRIVKNPRLKFNAERLCGERGLPALLDHFKDVKFKGKDHEEEDLDVLLSHLEHWTHRLYPSMKFEDTLHHIEKLGRKRPVQTCLRKIRMDMPILSKDFVSREDDEEEEDDVQRNEDDEPTETAENAFDRLVEESQKRSIDEPSTSAGASSSACEVADNSQESGFKPTLTDEQRKQIELRRSLALARRAMKRSSTAALDSVLNNFADNPSNAKKCNTEDEGSNSDRTEPSSSEFRIEQSGCDYTFSEETSAEPMELDHFVSSVENDNLLQYEISTDETDALEVDSLANPNENACDGIPEININPEKPLGLEEIKNLIRDIPKGSAKCAISNEIATCEESMS